MDSSTRGGFLVLAVLAGALACSEEAAPCDKGAVRGEFDGLSGCYAYCDEDTTCPSNFACTDNVCRCAANVCDNQCVDLQTSAAHCGSCGNECAWNAVCVDGGCEFPCGQNQARCDGMCVAFLTDRDNCGRCGQVCRDFEQCRDGFCR